MGFYYYYNTPGLYVNGGLGTVDKLGYVEVDTTGYTTSYFKNTATNSKWGLSSSAQLGRTAFLHYYTNPTYDLYLRPKYPYISGVKLTTYCRRVNSNNINFNAALIPGDQMQLSSSTLPSGVSISNIVVTVVAGNWPPSGSVSYYKSTSTISSFSRSGTTISGYTGGSTGIYSWTGAVNGSISSGDNYQKFPYAYTYPSTLNYENVRSLVAMHFTINYSDGTKMTSILTNSSKGFRHPDGILSFASGYSIASGYMYWGGWSGSSYRWLANNSNTGGVSSGFYPCAFLVEPDSVAYTLTFSKNTYCGSWNSTAEELIFKGDYLVVSGLSTKTLTCKAGGSSGPTRWTRTVSKKSDTASYTYSNPSLYGGTSSSGTLITTSGITYTGSFTNIYAYSTRTASCGFDGVCPSDHVICTKLCSGDGIICADLGIGCGKDALNVGDSPNSNGEWEEIIE